MGRQLPEIEHDEVDDGFPCGCRSCRFFDNLLLAALPVLVLVLGLALEWC